MELGDGMAKKIIGGLALALFAALPLGADPGASWLQIPCNARVAGMGQAFGAVADDPGALGLNPAGLADIQGPEVSLTHNFWILDSTVENVSYASALGEDSGWGVELGYVDFGTVNLYELSGNAPVAVGSINPLAWQAAAGGGVELLKDFKAGAALEYLFQSLTNGQSTSALALDLGLLYRVPEAGLAFSLSLLNTGSQLDGTDLPVDLKLGSAFRAMDGKQAGSDRLTFAVDGDVILDGPGLSSLAAGGEYWYRQVLAVRAGYRFAPYGKLEGVTGLSAGAGIRVNPFEFDYALTTLGDLASTNQLSLLIWL